MERRVENGQHGTWHHVVTESVIFIISQLLLQNKI